MDEFLGDTTLAWKRDPVARPSELMVEVAGRICYLSFSDDERKIRYPNDVYLKNLITQGHESVLEHVNWTFIMIGVSRAFSHQLVRHRPGFAYSQLSQQYHDESDAEFVEPYGIDSISGARDAWTKAVTAAHQAYRDLLGLCDVGADQTKEESRWIRSVARSVLPNATATALVVTANARALRHFLAVRGAIEGDYEMRRVSATLLDIVRDDAPSLFSDFETILDGDNEPLVTLNKSK